MIGRNLSHYRIKDTLGEGGMGTVYLAEDTELGRDVALKFLPSHLSSDEEVKKRFIREARAASALDHNNICTVHDVDANDDGQMYIVMAFCDGESLKEKIEAGRLPLITD